MNVVILMGRISRDIDVSQNGDKVYVRFSIAVQRDYKNKEGKYDADFINCVAFGKTAEFIEKYFSKGMKIGITGKIQTGSYTNKEGQKVYTTDVICEKAEFVESKNTAPQETKADISDFVSVPDGVDTELPFN